MQRRGSYEPHLDSGLKGWIVQMAKKNLWRVTPTYDLMDLIQDGYVAYGVCLQRYGGRVENQAHFMALVKRVYWSMIIDLANKKSEESGSLYVAMVDGKPSSGMLYEDALATVEYARRKNKVAWLAPTASEVSASSFNPTMSETSILEILAGGETSDAELRLTLSTAPQEIKALVADMEEGYLSGRHPRLKRNGRRETTNEFLNRLLKTSGFNYEQEFRRVLFA